MALLKNILYNECRIYNMLSKVVIKSKQKELEIEEVSESEDQWLGKI